MTLVVDAAAMVAALVDGGRDGHWVQAHLQGPAAAPHHMPVEVASVLRRAVLAGDLDPSAANAAHEELMAMPVALFEYRPLADRVWALRDSVSPYDAWYVALAEELDVPLVTLDRRLARAPGPRCAFELPPGE